MSNTFKKFYTVALAFIIAIASAVPMSVSADEGHGHGNVYMNEAGTFGVEVGYEKLEDNFSQLVFTEVKASEAESYKLKDILLDSKEDLGNWTYIVEDNAKLKVEVIYENDMGELESYDFNLVIITDVDALPENIATAYKEQVEQVEIAENVEAVEEVEIKEDEAVVEEAVEVKDKEEVEVAAPEVEETETEVEVKEDEVVAENKANEVDEAAKESSEEVEVEEKVKESDEEVEAKANESIISRAMSAIMSAAPMPRRNYSVTVQDIGTGKVGAGITPPGGQWVYNMGWPSGMPKIMVDGEIAYCIEPLTSPARTETAKKHSIGSIKELGLGPDSVRTIEFTQAKKRAVQLAAAYGYGYPGRTSNAWIWATQRVIWEELGWTVFADEIPSSWNEKDKVQQIKNDIRNHDKKPAWAGKKMEADNPGHTFVLDDKFLDTYKIDSSDNLRIVSHSGTKLRVQIVDPTKKGTINMSKKSATKKGSGSAIFTDGSSQKVIVGENPFDVKFSATFEVPLMDVTISKVTPDGRSIEDVEFEVLDANKKVIDTIKSGKDGIVRWQGKEGQYYLREKWAPAPYVTLKDDIPLKLSHNEPIPLDEIVNHEAQGQIKVRKVDEHGATVKGTKFEIKDSKGAVVDTITTGDNGLATSKTLPLGDYTVVEVSTPANLNLDTKPIPVSIKYKDHKTPIVEVMVDQSNKYQKSTLIVKKVEDNWDEIQSQYNGQALQGAELSVYAAEEIKEGNKTIFKKDEKVGSGVTDKDGIVKFESLPLGKYYVEEDKAPVGFNKFEGRWDVELKYNSGEPTVLVTETDREVENRVISGKARLVKHDEKWTLLEGATFGVFTKDGTKLMELKSNFAGRIVTPELRYGEYYFQEIEAPEGYWLDKTKIPFTISEQDEIVELTAPNYKIKAKLLVNKTDSETGEPLEGAKFKIWDVEANDWVKIKYADGMDVIEKDEWVTDENGQFLMEATIPYGKYKLIETEAPEGFLIHDPIDINIDKSQDYIELDVIGVVLPTDVGNDPIRSDVQIVKVDKETGERLKDFAFRLTNMETGKVVDTITSSEDGTIRPNEDGIIRSNEDGIADFGSLRYGMYMVEEVEVGGEYLIDKEPQFINITEHGKVYEVTFKNEQPKGELVLTKVDFKDGTPVAGAGYGLFNLEHEMIDEGTTDENGIITFKEIPLGNYYVKELSSPKEYVLDENEYHVSVDYIDDVTPVIHLEQEVKEWRVPEIGTEAAFVERDKEEPNIVTLVDEVRYENLVPGREYVVEGYLMNKETNEPILIDDEKVMGRTEFVADSIDGSVDVTFVFDANKLKTNKVVVFEDLYEDEIVVAVHHDINDEKQTVEIPEIGTEAALVEVDRDEPNIATIVDQVHYEGLLIGETYEVTGMLMDKETEEPIIIDGEPVTGSTTFVAEETEGTVEVEFTLDLNELKTDTVVVFEDLYNGERLIAVHHDINDEEQTVRIPDVKTEASYVGLDKEEPHIVTIVDKVRYENLIVGKEYTVDGFLMDKETNKPVLIDGEKVTGSTTFVAEETEGIVEVEFTFDVNKLKSKRVVVFEDLYEEGRLIAVHHDINDEDQTVDIPSVGTKASYVGLDKDAPHIVTIVDEVHYENLIVGEEYQVNGKLMDKETGLPVLIDGKEVTGSTTFVAEEAEGTVEVEFTFDVNKLKTDTVVVFEDLYNGDRLIAVHHDINDKDQTVDIPRVGTTASLTDVNEETDMVTITDEVRYESLIPGKEYRVEGKLMDKETGLPVLIDGKEVTGSTTFIAESPNGTVDVEFTFDRSKLKTKTVVVFEDLYQGERLIAVHHDINDADQTVDIPQPEAPTPTGDVQSALTVSVGLITLAAAKFYMDIRRKREA